MNGPHMPSPRVKPQLTFQTATIILLALTLLVRLVTLRLPEITDTSESRFATAAQEMLLSGDWITPRIYRGEAGWEPYWAKPPLQIWLTGASMALHGQNPFGARFPSFLGALLTIFFTYRVAKAQFNTEVAQRSVVILSTMFGFFILSGLCLTDMLLTASITATTAAILRALDEEIIIRRRRAWYWAATSAGIGMLIKGPVSVVLPTVTLVLFLISRWVSGTAPWPILRSIPWIGATLVFLLTWCPWYLLAEARTPGFLNYFFLHENILRYFHSDLKVLYGIGHRVPFGTIWWHWLAMALPWTLLVPCFNLKRLHALTYSNPANLFIALWALTAPLFFTFARQVLATYVLPALPAFALLLGVSLQHLSIRSIPFWISRSLYFTFLLGAAGAVGFCFLGDPSATNGLLLAVVGMVAVLFPRFPTLEIRMAAVSLALIAAAAPWLASIATADRSTGPLLEAMSTSGSDAPRILGAVMNNPRSAVFYGRATSPLPVTVIGGLTPERALELGIRDLIIQRDKYQALPDSLRIRFREIKSLGAWSWVRAQP
jgi:4-amino-4-deoxy-L-arabinose transferase-like glycosyltransferase